MVGAEHSSTVSRSRSRVRALRMSRPCFRADEITERQAREVGGALQGSESAGDLDLHLHHSQVLLGEVVGEGNSEVDEEPEGRLLEGLEPDEEIVSGPLLLALFRVHRGIEGRQAPVQGEAFPDGGPIPVLERLDGFGRGAPPRPAPWPLARPRLRPEASPPGPRPRAPCCVSQTASKLSQEMGVAEGVKDVFEGVVGAPVVVDHHAALELGHRAGLAGAIERVGRRRGGVPPTGRAGDAEARFVEAAHRRHRDARADAAPHQAPAPRPCGEHQAATLAPQAAAAQNRSCRTCAVRSSGTSCWALRSAATTLTRSPFSGRRNHALGEVGAGAPAAGRAVVDRCAVLGHDQRLLRKIENLALLLATFKSARSSARQCAQTSAACSTIASGSATWRSVPPRWPFWPPLRLPERVRKLFKTRGLLVHPSLEGGLELLELSNPSRRRSSAFSASSASIRRIGEATSS